MAVYRCQECDSYVDNDYNPCEVVKGELVCPDCYEEMQTEDEIDG
jgi:hypothetical protein